MPQTKHVVEGAPLTSTEQETVLRLAKGYGAKEIAAHLGVSTRTVTNHYCTKIRVKLGASTMYEAIAIAVRTGVIA